MGKQAECVHREFSEEPREYITQITIEDARKSIKIGQQFEWYKKQYGDGEECKTNGILRGRVIEIYNNFFVVRMENGTKESIKWIDLILAQKKKGRIVI